MLIKRYQRSISIFLTALMFLSLFTGVQPVLADGTTDSLQSPVVDNEGNVTFNAVHDGDALYVVGSLNEWDISNAIPMENVDGVFTKTISLDPGTYEYKFAKGTSWEEGDFPDQLNPLMNGGNSVVHVPGVKVDEVPDSVEVGSETTLTGTFFSPEGTTNDEAVPTWSIAEDISGVAINSDVLAVSNEAQVGETFTIQAEFNGYVSTKEVLIVDTMNEFTINYYRHDGTAMDWDMWIWGNGMNGAGYEFQSMNGEFASGTYEFVQNELSIITRLGEWDSQEMERTITMPDGENQVEVWIVQGDEEVYYSEPAIGDDFYPPTVRFVYERENQDYEGWNIWTWNTGAREGQIDFEEVAEVATANIEVGPTNNSMGFKLRKGTDWSEVDVDEDRTIQISPTEDLTKVFVKEGEVEFRTVPFASAPVIDQGNVSFFYRDAELYRENAMNTIDSVQVKLDGNVYDMTFEEENERFITNVEDLAEGTYEYTYVVSKNGETQEIADPYNVNDEGKSFITLSSVDITIDTEVSPNSINYNQNAVLSLHVVDGTGNELDANSIREMYVDLTAVGGDSKTAISPELNEVTIAVSDQVTAGTKTLPVTVVDVYGGTHTNEAEIHVEPRVVNGEEDFDWDEARIYFMLTDRFADGNEANNNNIGYDPTSPGSYQGGDFKGVTQNLDYLDDLGINTIWITPIVENVYHDVAYNDPNANNIPYHSYHGYWGLDFEELNPHLGTLEEFHELIDAASERGIKIMVDVVLNHAGYGLKMDDGNVVDPQAGYPTDEDRLRFEDMLRQDGGDYGDEVTGELSGLPDFKTEDPLVRETIVDWQVNWLEKATTDNGNTIDYFRVDTVKHVDEATLMHFKNELTKTIPEFKMIGEAFGATATNEYADRYLNTGTMDSLLDFEFKSIARDLVNGNIRSVDAKIQERNDVIDNTGTMGQFLGSHDEDGFLHYIGDQDTSKLMAASTLQITSKGQPVIYYGEELGLSGINNWPQYDNRYVFPWDEVEGNDVHAHYQKLLNIRDDYSKIFSKGSYELIAGNNENGYMIYKRTYKGKSVIVGINTNEAAVDVNIAVPFVENTTAEDVYNDASYSVDGNRTMTITLPGRVNGGTVILTSDQDDADGEIVVPEIPEDTLRVHYQRDDNNYTDLGLWLWEDVEFPSENWPSGGTPFVDSQITEYGAYVDIPLQSDAQKVGFLVLNTVTGDKDGGDKFVELFSPEINEVWITQGSDDVSLVAPVDLPENTIRIHYERDDQNYDGWSAWTWGDVAAPTDGWPDGAHDPSGIDKFGAYYDIELAEGAEQIGFLFVNKNSGEQTGDYQFSMLEYKQIFITDGDDQVYTNPYGSVPVALLSGEILSDEKIQLRFSKTDGLTEEELLSGVTVLDSDGNEMAINGATVIDDVVVELYGSFDLEKAPFNITYGEQTVSASAGWRMIDEMYGYDGELGAELHADGTATLKLWSPKAENVSVVLYDKDNQFDVVHEEILMTLGERGVWEVTLDEANTGLNSLHGYYYHYKITHDGETKLALDPYAKSMATWANPEMGGEYPIGKAAIVDPSTIGPELDFANIDGFEKKEDAIIYEVHVRDFTSDPSIADELNAQFGTFASFVEKLDYIEDLGVTHIQLLPVMSYFFGNEWASDERLLEWASSNTNYNWGYDPHSYFSLSGMYSENPDDPEQRIAEFKRLIDEIHSRGMGVVLDVVYNHTARVDIFEDLVPNYYHFMDADGTPRESFGGGRLGTTHEMSRKVLVDSITYWVEEFKIDGFRFDMMGDHDAESIQIAYDTAKAINPNIIMIGEGWRTFAGDEGEPVMPADQDWMQHTDSVGVFSDEFRNELKSGFGSEGQPRFLTGGARNIQQIFDNLTAKPHNFVADDPGDVVSYIAAHDNLTLHDVIAQSIKKDPEFHEEEIHKRIRLGNAMVLTAQGTAFIHAGQEFGRTKQYREETTEAPYKSTYLTDESGNPFVYPYFIHDSYDSSDMINKIDWQMATNEELYPIQTQTREFTTGLIKLRRSTDAFTLGTMDEVNNNVTLLDVPEIGEHDLTIAYRAVSSDGNEEYYVFLNADDKERTLTLNNVDLQDDVVVVDSDESGVNEVVDPTGFELTSDQITLDALTTVVVKVSHEVEEPGDGDEPDEGEEEPGDSEEPGNEEDPEEGEKPGTGNNDGNNKGNNGNDGNNGNNGKDNNSNNGNSNDGVEKDEEGKKLPKTATNYYNWLLVGFGLLLVGTIAIVMQRRRKTE
ncbi:pullulanase [Ornithinibacillus halophilus]|uniref:pullulanase n=1 Tax=Ornithinibacillus halophilus TaxID=930117 RepID=A0A1M5HM35_9BACI|nr:pullulanase [Ornithinibacillus halophilus]SHG17029.1 pullulanase, extracellular [Ornithinibacillus halophilus]